MVSVRQVAFHAPQAIIYVVDSTDRDRIGISREEFHSLLSEDELAEALILVYANKQASSAGLGFRFTVCSCQRSGRDRGLGLRVYCRCTSTSGRAPFMAHSLHNPSDNRS